MEARFASSKPTRISAAQASRQSRNYGIAAAHFTFIRKHFCFTKFLTGRGNAGPIPGRNTESLPFAG